MSTTVAGSPAPSRVVVCPRGPITACLFPANSWVRPASGQSGGGGRVLKLDPGRRRGGAELAEDAGCACRLVPVPRLVSFDPGAGRGLREYGARSRRWPVATHSRTARRPSLMKPALSLPNFRDKVTIKELEDLTRLAETLDFDSVWTL